MKKSARVLTVMTFALFCFSASAQIFGIKGGVGIANITSPNEFDNSRFGRTFGAKIAGTVEFDITDNLYLGSGLGFAKRGASTLTDNINLFYVELPVGARYDILEIGGSGYLYATSGLNFGFLVAANEGGQKLEIGNKIGDEVKGLDFGLNIGVGVIFNEQFEVGLLTEFGLLDISSSNADKLRNAAIMVSFGYKFGQ